MMMINKPLQCFKESLRKNCRSLPLAIHARNYSGHLQKIQSNFYYLISFPGLSRANPRFAPAKISINGEMG